MGVQTKVTNLIDVLLKTVQSISHKRIALARLGTGALAAACAHTLVSGWMVGCGALNAELPGPIARLPACVLGKVLLASTHEIPSRACQLYRLPR